MVDAKKVGESVREKANEVKSATEVTKGKAKSATGKSLRKKKLQAEGQAEILGGRARQAAQHLKKSVKELGAS